MIQRGLVIGGKVLDDTAWCQRDSSAFWLPGDFGTRPRAPLMTLNLGHWTAGEAGLQRFDDDGPTVVGNMKRRKKPDGAPLSCSVHFVIGACHPDDEFAPVWQSADPGTTACVSVGKGWINGRAIATEVVSAGLPGPFDARKRPQRTTLLLGRPRVVLDFYKGQINSWIRLSQALTRDGLKGVAIPRRVPRLPGRRFDEKEARRWIGGIEHYMVPGTTKLDAAGLLMSALEDSGWDRLDP